jgi:hypothetical protein
MSVHHITKKIQLQWRKQRPNLKHVLTSGRNNTAYKMTNYDCVDFQFKKIQPVEKTTFRFKTFSARRNNVAKSCLIMYSCTRQNDRTS